MSLRRHPQDPEEDVAAVRAALGSANPVTASSSEGLAPPGWALARPDAGVPIRRRAVTLTAVATAAALVAAIVAVGYVGGSAGRRVGVSTSPRALLAASTTTVEAGSATGHLVVTLGSMVIDAKGTADLATGDADLNMNLPTPLGEVEVINIGTTSYLHVPNAFTTFTAGKPWVKIDRGALEELAGGKPGTAQLGAGMDFQGVLAWLRGAADVTITGPGHYHALLDLTRAANQAPVGQRGRLEAVAQAINQPIPADITLDESGRLTHLETAVDMGKLRLPPGASRSVPAAGILTLKLDLQNFGTAFHVNPPASDQVTDAPSILSARGGPSR